MIDFIRKWPMLILAVVVVLVVLVAASATIGVVQTITMLAIVGTALVMGAIVVGSIAG